MRMPTLALPWRLRVVPLACALACPALPLRASATQITVGPNVHVSRADPTSTFTEVMLSAHPADPARLLGCAVRYVTGENKRETVLLLSTDGGATWQTVFDTGHFPDSADPACTFDVGDLAFHTALGIGESVPDSFAIGSYRSTDGGRTWQRGADLWSKMGTLDRQSITVDTSSASPYRGRVYVNGTSSVPSISGTLETRAWSIALHVSPDSGRTYRRPIHLVTTTGYVLGMGNSVVLSDGTVISLFGELRENTSREVRNSTKGHPNADLKVVVSTDGGDRLGPAVTVSDWYMPWNRPYGCCSPSLASDPGSPAFKDRLYAVFSDERAGRPDILLSRSSDRGKTWSKPMSVTDDRAALDPAQGPRNFLPAVAVNKDGVVGIMWYHIADPQGDPGWEVRFAASFDGGETVTPSILVSAQPARFDARAEIYAAAYRNFWQRDTTSGGTINVDVTTQVRQFCGCDYAGLAADAAGRFHAFWVDNRTSYLQVWTAVVTAPGRALQNGSPDLAELADVSRRVRLEVGGTRFDRGRGQVSVSAKLKNVGTDTLRGPVKVRVVQLRSELGVPTVVGAENGVAGPGAVWDFTTTLSGGVLAPNAESAAKPLTFRLADLRPFVQGDEWKYRLVSFEARVLGR